MQTLTAHTNIVGGLQLKTMGLFYIFQLNLLGRYRDKMLNKTKS